MEAPSKSIVLEWACPACGKLRQDAPMMAPIYELNDLACNCKESYSGVPLSFDVQKMSNFFRKMAAMDVTMTQAENMTDEELAEALCKIVWHEDIATLNNSVVGEVLHRWRHPWKHKLKLLREGLSLVGEIFSCLKI